MLALLLVAASVVRAGEPCPLEHYDRSGRSVPGLRLEADAPYCRLLTGARGDFEALLRAALLTPSHYRLGFDGRDPEEAATEFMPGDSGHLDSGVIVVGPETLRQAVRAGDRGPELLRGVLAHEVGHAARSARGRGVISPSIAQDEGAADGAGMELLELTNNGGPEAMRRAFVSIYGCREIVRTMGQEGRMHPAAGTRYESTVTAAWVFRTAPPEVLSAMRQHIPVSAVEFTTPDGQPLFSAAIEHALGTGSVTPAVRDWLAQLRARETRGPEAAAREAARTCPAGAAPRAG